MNLPNTPATVDFSKPLALSRNPFGRLVLQKNEQTYTVNPVRAFPLSAPMQGISLIAEDGMLKVLYHMGITNELFPLLIFIGIGAQPLMDMIHQGLMLFA